MGKERDCSGRKKRYQEPSHKPKRPAGKGKVSEAGNGDRSIGGRSPFYFYIFWSGCGRSGVAVSGLHRRSGGPTETLPGRKAETDRVCIVIFEGRTARRIRSATFVRAGEAVSRPGPFRERKPRRVAPGGAGANGHATTLRFSEKARAAIARCGDGWRLAS